MKKQFRNLDEQISILRDKGLIITNEENAKNILLRENYFFLSGYRYPLLQPNDKSRFIDGTTFEELYGIFLFDRYFRDIIFKYLLIVENNLKSIFSYHLSKKYGYQERDYLNYKNFTNDRSKKRRVLDIIKKMRRQININARQHSATMHYINNYGYIPLWVLVKVLSFGLISELYSVLKEEDKIEIANIYHIEKRELEDYLPILANYRNICAHEDIIYNHKTEKRINTNECHRRLNIPTKNDEYLSGKNDLFALIIMLKWLLTEKEFRLMMREIEYEISQLSGTLKSIPISSILKIMGFVDNYMELVNI